MLHKNRSLYTPTLLILITFTVLLTVIEVIMQGEGFSVGYMAKAIINSPHSGQKQGTLNGFPSPIPTSTPTPTVPYTPPTQTPIPPTRPAEGRSSYPTLPAGQIVTPKIGGALNPDAPYYCIDDEDPDGCDDNTAFHVPKGAGGPSAMCGTVIEMGHQIVKSLPQELKGMRDRLNPAIANNCHNTGTYSGGYISTFFIIDSHKLAGFPELSKTNTAHIVGTNLLNWWKTAPTPYSFAAYTGGDQLKQNLIGKVMFINTPSGVHVGVVNNIEIYDTNGNGIISIIQSGARFYLDRFEIVGWQIKNTPQHQTVINGVAGFGSAQ